MTPLANAEAKDIAEAIGPRSKARFWVHDKTRRCSITLGTESAEENLQEGFREVTAKEQDAFRAITRQQFPHLLK